MADRCGYRVDMYTNMLKLGAKIGILFGSQSPQKLVKRSRVSQSLKKSSDDSSETEPQSATDGTKALSEAAEAAGSEVTSAEEGAAREKTEGAVDGEHTCSECGMVFQRRYTLIMHMLKHEKSRSFKCTVRTCSLTTAHCVPDEPVHNCLV